MNSREGCNARPRDFAPDSSDLMGILVSRTPFEVPIGPALGFSNSSIVLGKRHLLCGLICRAHIKAPIGSKKFNVRSKITEILLLFGQKVCYDAL